MLNEQAVVTNIYSDNQQALITINNIPDNTSAIAQIFENIAQQNINIDLISQTTPLNGRLSISFTLPRKDLEKAIDVVNDLQALLPTISLNTYEDIVKLSVEGPGMAQQPGIAAKVFSIMAQQNIRIMAITTSETKISYVIHTLDEKKALEALMEAFEL
ncbi:ACT domain-containing protein [Caldicoprobacter guelmensis]|uniref:ACT domain-containing protein n=1 Tax=Caldicoprobacter guelmensis TaxID=1170224 RepID=UPI0024348BEE|nr:ACT domain-containing protein [Caldicoprobacter guelmensis]